MKIFALILLLVIETGSGFYLPQSAPTARMTLCHVKPSSFALQATNYYDDEEDDDDDAGRVKVPRRRQRGRLFENEEEESEFYDRVEERVYGSNREEFEEEEDDDDDEDDDEEWEDYDTFSNVVIDNPILDSIDPDGAFERFPELARDPRFWIDMVLFICFLNFLSDIGPQNTLPDTLWYPNGPNLDVIGVNTLS